MKKTIEELEKELQDMKKFHETAWKEFGSELCTGDMEAQEAKLKFEIDKAKWMSKKMIKE